jgi:signal transduction histidine kinase
MPELAEHVKLAGTEGAQPSSPTASWGDYYDLHISLLTTPSLVPIGRVLVPSDTQHKRDQAELERARNQLEAVVEQRTEELRQSNEQMRTLALLLQELEEAERQELAVELHDRVGQNLTGLNLNLKILQDQLLPGCGPEIHRRLDESLNIVEETTHRIRDVMSDLYPPVLDEYGLLAAIKWYGADFGSQAGHELCERLPDHPPS